MKPFGHFSDRKIIYDNLVEVRSFFFRVLGADSSHSSFPYFLHLYRPSCNWLIVESEATRIFFHRTILSPGEWWSSKPSFILIEKNSRPATNISLRSLSFQAKIIFPIRFDSSGEILMLLIDRNVLTGAGAGRWKICRRSEINYFQRFGLIGSVIEKLITKCRQLESREQKNLHRREALNHGKLTLEPQFSLITFNFSCSMCVEKIKQVLPKQEHGNARLTRPQAFSS